MSHALRKVPWAVRKARDALPGPQGTTAKISSTLQWGWSDNAPSLLADTNVPAEVDRRETRSEAALSPCLPSMLSPGLRVYWYE